MKPAPAGGAAGEGLFHQAIAESPASGMVRSPDAAASFAKQFAEELGAGNRDGATLMTAKPAELMAALDRVIHGAVVDMPGAFPAGPASGHRVPAGGPGGRDARGARSPGAADRGQQCRRGRLFTKFMQLLPTNEAMIERILAHVPAAQRARITATATRSPRTPASSSAATSPSARHRGRSPARTCGTRPRTRTGTTMRRRRIALDGSGRHSRDRTARGLRHVPDAAGLGAHRRHGRKSALRISNDVQNRWRAFARTGVPGEGWPQYGADDRAVLVFDRRPASRTVRSAQLRPLGRLSLVHG